MSLDFSPELLWAGASVLVLIVVNALLGIWRAVVDGDFDVRELPRFLYSHVLSDLGPLLILGAASVVHPAVKVMYLASVAALDLKYLAKIRDKLTGTEPYPEEEI